MVTNYKYKITYRKKSENTQKLQQVRDYSPKHGTEVIRTVGGKPFISRYVHESYFLSLENAENAYRRLQASTIAKYVKLKEGNFAVEELRI